MTAAATASTDRLTNGTGKGGGGVGRWKVVAKSSSKALVIAGDHASSPEPNDVDEAVVIDVGEDAGELVVA